MEKGYLARLITWRLHVRLVPPLQGIIELKPAIYYNIYTYMAKFKEKLKAREFRRKGVSIIEIAKKLGVSKGSVSLWCQDIRLTDEQKNKLQAGSIKGGYKGRMIGAEMNRRKK